jgi:hypothetical protein
MLMDHWAKHSALHHPERRIRSSFCQLQRLMLGSLRLTRPVTVIVSTMHGMHHMEKASNMRRLDSIFPSISQVSTACNKCIPYSSRISAGTTFNQGASVRLSW